MPFINPLRERADVLHRRVVGDPVANQTPRVLAPELVVPFRHLLRDLRQRLAVDPHDDAERLQIRVHPVERETLLDVEFVGRIFVEDDLGQQSVDGHDCHLAADRHPVVVGIDVFALPELVQLFSPKRVIHVFVESLLGITRRRRDDFRGRIDSLVPPAIFDPLAQRGEVTVERSHQPG